MQTSCASKKLNNLKADLKPQNEVAHFSQDLRDRILYLPCQCPVQAKSAHCTFWDYATLLYIDLLFTEFICLLCRGVGNATAHHRRSKLQITPAKPPDNSPANCMVMADMEVQPSPFIRELVKMKEAYITDQDPPSRDTDGEPVPLSSLRQIYASFVKASTSEGLDPAQVHPELHGSQTTMTS